MSTARQSSSFGNKLTNWEMSLFHSQAWPSFVSQMSFFHTTFHPMCDTLLLIARHYNNSHSKTLYADIVSSVFLLQNMGIRDPRRHLRPFDARVGLEWKASHPSARLLVRVRHDRLHLNPLVHCPRSESGCRDPIAKGCYPAL